MATFDALRPMTARTVLMGAVALVSLSGCAGGTTGPTVVPQSFEYVPVATPPQLVHVPEAATACDDALGPQPVASAISDGQARQPVLIMFKYMSNEEGWYARPELGAPFETATDTQSIEALVCVRQWAFTVGTYEQLATANRLDWDALVMTWPDRQVEAADAFTGGDPPERMPAGRAGFGEPPTDAFRAWLPEHVGG